MLPTTMQSRARCGIRGMVEGGKPPFYSESKGGDDLVENRTAKFKRHRQARWDRRNLRTVSTKLPVSLYRELLDVCMLENCAPYTYMRNLLIWAIESRRSRR